MKVLVLFACLVAAVAATSLPAQYRVGGGRIVGGQNAQPNEAPYMISIRLRILTRLSHMCGGSIITLTRVLTAAHCRMTGTMVAVAGDHQISVDEPSEQHRVITNFVIHPLYPGGNAVAPNDIAVATVESPFIQNAFVNVIALPVADVVPTGWATLYGWGSTSNTTQSNAADILQVIEKSILTHEECLSFLSNPSSLDRTNLCTGPVGQNVDACGGDSGGPLVQLSGGILRVIGIVSWGPFPCGRGPSVKVRTSAFNDFILQNL